MGINQYTKSSALNAALNNRENEQRFYLTYDKAAFFALQ